MLLQVGTWSTEAKRKTGGANRFRRSQMFACDSGAEADAELSSDPSSVSSSEYHDEAEYYWYYDFTDAKMKKYKYL